MAWFVLSVFASVLVCVFSVVAAALDRALLGSKLLLLSVLAKDAELPRAPRLVCCDTVFTWAYLATVPFISYLTRTASSSFD